MSTNPAECDRTTVYAGECRNFADTEWIRFDSGRRRSPDARDGNTWLIDVAHGSFWMSDDKVRNLVPLVPAADRQWTRDDLPYYDEIPSVYAAMQAPQPGKPRPCSEAQVASDTLDAVVEYLNAHHPKPEPDHKVPWKTAALNWEIRADRAERERDAAVARAEQAEKRHTWPKVTPTGHTYVEPRTYEALRHEHDNAAQAAVESWAADECPPEPTWEMVGSAHREVERLQRERDEWKARAEAAEREASTWRTSTESAHSDFLQAAHDRDEWKARAENLEREFAEFKGNANRLNFPAVTRADIDRALIDVTSNAMNYPTPSQMLGKDTGPLRRKCVDAMCDLLGIEAEQVVDPVESKARELYRAVMPDARWETVADEYRRIAAHVIEQETDHE